MKITQQVINVHQFTASEWVAMCEAENTIRHIMETYDNGIVLTSPNTGECINIDELPRVLGILSFLTENRVVEANPA
jgi:hypothetical protein